MSIAMLYKTLHLTVIAEGFHYIFNCSGPGGDFTTHVTDRIVKSRTFGFRKLAFHIQRVDTRNMMQEGIKNGVIRKTSAHLVTDICLERSYKSGLKLFKNIKVFPWNREFYQNKPKGRITLNI